MAKTALVYRHAILSKQSYMLALWDQMLVFLQHYGWWLALSSLIIFAISIASIPFIVARIPIDYFTPEGHQRQRERHQHHHPITRLIKQCIKNTLGAMLFIAGVIMLFTPGQGILSILFGLMIMNYPGKYRLECYIIRKPLIFNAINAMRQKQHKPPLHAPDQ